MENNTSSYQLSAVQKGLWLDMEANQSLSNHQINLTIEGDLDRGLLKQAILDTLNYFQILKASFAKSNKNLQYPLIQINEQISAKLEIEELDLSHLVSAMRDPHLLQLSEAMLDQGISHPDFKLVRVSESTHILIMTIPALLADKRSMVLVANHIFKSYEDGVESHSADDTIQFVEFSAWHNESLKEENPDSDAFWKQREEALKNSTSFSLFEPTHMDPRQHASFQIDFDLQESKEVQNYCTKNGFDQEYFALTIWSIVIAQYFGYNKNLAIARVATGRSLENFEGIVGPMAKALPFQLLIDQELTFSECYEKIAEEVSLSEDMQDSFEDVGFSAPIQFEYTEQSDLVHQLEGIKVKGSNLKGKNTSVKLKMTCHWVDGLVFELQYDASELAINGVQCLCAQLRHCVLQVIQSDKKPLEQLMTATDTELELIMQQFNDTHFSFAGEGSILDDIALQASLLSNKLALKGVHERVDYLMLDKSSNQLANLLKDKYQIEKGDIVAICEPRDPSLIIHLLGILKAGAAYLPIDPELPAKRLAYILKDSGAKLLLCNETFDDLKDTNILTTAALNKDINKSDTENPWVHRSPGDIFYVIYTSGSTGKPKGVKVSDGAITNYVRWFAEKNSINEEDKTALFTTIAFDLNYTALWSSLISGSALHLQPESPVFDPDAFMHQIIKEGITYLKMTPSHFKLWLASENFDVMASELQLRLIVLGGEAIDSEDVKKFLSYRDDVKFMNHYGPTETTVGIISESFDKHSFQEFESRPVLGTPIFNNKIQILNTENEMLPVGVWGEICVGGKNVADGYLNRVQLTTEKFIANPLDQNETIYKTGDLGRWLPCGKIEFQGRKDFQVKVKGFRIELNEIANTLKQMKEIQQAIVMARTDSDKESELIGFYVSKEPVANQTIIGFLREHLPAYMIPNRIFRIDKFPMLANGKIDTGALNKLPMESNQKEDLNLPKTTTEKFIASVWLKVLDVEEIDVHQNFFDIGGNSFKLIKVFRALSKEFDEEVTLTDLFKHNTIHDMAKFLGDDKEDQPKQESIFGFEV